MRDEDWVTITTTHHTRKGIRVNRKKKYGLMAFLFDVIMTCITGGLWLIWIFVREMRNN